MVLPEMNIDTLKPDTRMALWVLDVCTTLVLSRNKHSCWLVCPFGKYATMDKTKPTSANPNG